MRGHTKKHPTDTAERVSLVFRVRAEHVEKVKRLVASIEQDATVEEAITADEFYRRHFADTPRAAVRLKGLRTREGLTQEQLAHATGIPRRHLSEMENGKRAIGKKSAQTLADTLGTDYRSLL